MTKSNRKFSIGQRRFGSEFSRTTINTNKVVRIAEVLQDLDLRMTQVLAQQS
jgi:hypothetical protein